MQGQGGCPEAPNHDLIQENKDRARKERDGSRSSKKAKQDSDEPGTASRSKPHGKCMKIEIPTEDGTPTVWTAQGLVSSASDCTFCRPVETSFYIDSCSSFNFISPNRLQVIKEKARSAGVPMIESPAETLRVKFANNKYK